MTDYIERSVKGTFTVAIFSFLAVLSGYLTRIFLARTISSEQFGLFYSIFTLFMFIAIFTDMGYNQSLVKYIPEFVISKNKKALSKLIKYVINTNLVLTVIISAIILTASQLIATKYLHLPESANLIMLGVLILIFNNMMGFVQTLFQAFQNMFKHGLVYFLSKSLFLVFTMILFYAGFVRNVKLPLVAYILSCLSVLAIFSYSVYKLIMPRIKNPYFDKKMFLRITRFAIPNMISTIAGTVIGYIDTIILTPLVSLTLVGIYNTTISTILILSYLGTVVATVLFPLISELSYKKQNKNTEQIITIIYKYSLIIISPFALGMFFFAEDILRILFGEAFIVGATAMSILSIGVIFLVIAQINFAIMNGLGKPKQITHITIFAAAFNTISNIILIPYFGINGAALTTTISYLIMMIWSYITVKKNINMTSPKIWSIIISSTIFFLSLYGLKNIIHTNMYTEIILTSLISIILYILSLLILKTIDIKEIKNILKKIVRK